MHYRCWMSSIQIVRVLLAASSTLMNQQKNEREIYLSGYEAALESAKVTDGACDETMGKMEVWLNLWFMR